jgi:NAD(P)-dependent dehydrogenase (short-subunit alcohol dehydrogenase family)
MGQELSGKVAIVTGGASGIGRATVELFAAEGARVVIADVDVEGGEALAAALGEAVAFKRTDVADADEVQALVDFAVDTFGGLHVMFNNAGISSSFRRFLRDDLRDFDRVMAVNLFGVISGTQRAARHMAEHGGGSIINTSSIGGLTGGGPPIAYRTSKAAIAQFSRMVATDLAEYGVRVNCIAPGHIPTGITDYDLGPTIELDQPLQRRGTPRDVAEAVLFLAGERSAQITGILVPVDGGTLAGRPVGQLARGPVTSDEGGAV